jgi:hypothetical protein
VAANFSSENEFFVYLHLFQDRKFEGSLVIVTSMDLTHAGRIENIIGPSKIYALT